MKSTGKLAGSAMNCHAKATKKGEPVDPACQLKAEDKHDSAFTKAEGKGGCATTGDAAAIGADVDQFATDTATALAPAANKDAQVCASKKMKAAGKKTKSFATCYAKAAKKAEVVDAACLSKAEGKFDSAFAKAEAKGGCTTVGDSAAIMALVDALIGGAVGDLIAVCGDDIAGPGEACDGLDDLACPGECNGACVCAGTCGDGVAEALEECDDGGTDDGDGCSSTCQLEDASALCAGVSSVSGTDFTTELVASGFDKPTHVAAAPLDPHRLFVVEQDGIIHVIENGSVLPTPFLDISAAVQSPDDPGPFTDEQGLLSIAFHPDYETNGRFFLNYTRISDAATVVSRWEVSGDPNVADAGSELVMLVTPQFAPNHNGGQLAFDSAGFLYVGMGDGGAANDPTEAGQDDSTLLAKLLRLDIDVESAPYYAVPASNPDPGAGDPLGLIWATGLRNPWRFSFDRANDDLYIADVGQNQIEEINWVAGTSTGGENYGWDIFEGTDCFEPAPDPDCPDPPTGFTMPVTEYTHAVGFSVTGGFSYRGCALPDLHGTYFYADYVSNIFLSLVMSGGVATNEQDVTASFGGISSTTSFGEDARGELYIASRVGGIYRLIPD